MFFLLVFVSCWCVELFLAETAEAGRQATAGKTGQAPAGQAAAQALHRFAEIGAPEGIAQTTEPAAGAAGLTYVAHGPTCPVPGRRLVIDHVLVSPDVVVGAVEVRSTEMSDHAALLVDLDLGPAAPAAVGG